MLSGDRVLVLLPSAPEWYPCVLGMMKLGVVVRRRKYQVTKCRSWERNFLPFFFFDFSSLFFFSSLLLLFILFLFSSFFSRWKYPDLCVLFAQVCPVTHTSTPFEVSYRLQQLDASAIITVILITKRSRKRNLTIERFLYLQQSFAHAECIEAAEKSVIRVLKIKVLIGAEPRAVSLASSSWRHRDSSAIGLDQLSELDWRGGIRRSCRAVPRHNSSNEIHRCDVHLLCFGNFGKKKKNRNSLVFFTW